MKRGSALLVVLGLLSFLIISAVAFSMYMRAERLPSSYLLRSSTSRQLAKAALTRVMKQIDDAIGNNPHPGVGGNEANFWRGRVFFGGSDVSTLDNTVATTTLEGLAYLPAPLINSTRYYSRLTPTASWQYMDMDVGRFAYTAVDVSDYFDVHRTQAAPEGGGRTSADNARVSLAYLFEDPEHKSKDNWRVDPDAWDTFMEKFTGPNDVPLVSWADFNLALWDTGNNAPAGVISPWCRFVEGDSTEFLQATKAEYQMLSNEVFVTDSLYARTKDKYFNLAQSSDQPFPGMMGWNKDSYANRSADDALQNVSTKRLDSDKDPFWTQILSPPEIVQLCDYLDTDDVPSTLALPTVERTPMITGVYLHPGSMVVKIESNGTGYDTPEFVQAGGTYRYHVTTYTATLVVDELSATVGFVYPFRHGRGVAGKSYDVQAFASFTFVREDQDNLRPGTSGWATVPDWTGQSDTQPQKGVFGNAANRPSGYWVRSSPVQITAPDDIEDEDDAIMDDKELKFGTFNLVLSSKLTASSTGISGLKQDECTMRVCQKMLKNSKDDSWTPTADEPIREFGALPAAANLGEALSDADLQTDDEFRPSIQLWVRITDPSAKQNCQTVDLMPACVSDDANASQLVSEPSGSRSRPALRFWGPDACRVKIEKAQLSGGGDVALTPQAYVTGDPRFNYAPENCWAVENLSGMVGETWKNRAKAMYASRDGDLFMSTSDAGYLQSKYELAFMLRIANFDENEDYGCLSGSAYDGRARSVDDDKKPLAADAAMWRTYSPYAVNGHSDKTALDKFPIVNGLNGTRICPYTPSRTIMMGALANTPHDWWSASTNDTETVMKTETVKKAMLGDIVKALEYTFSEYSNDPGCSGVKWAALERLADTLIARLRTSAKIDGWKDLYDGLAWDGSLLDDVENSTSDLTLYSVDRKFLHGFWRECFATRQQLFLVFIRAEPLLLGSGSLTRIPPVLSSRAVALVWRNPNEPSDTSAPHNMRVLFYRPLD